MQPLDSLIGIIPGFDSLDSALVAQLAAISRIVRVTANTVLCNQGTAPNALRWLLHGQVALSQAGPSGEPAIIDVVRPISGIALASAILAEPSAMTARSLTLSRVLRIEAAPLRVLTTTRPALATTIMRAMSLDIVSATRQIVDLKVRKAAQRLGCYLLSLVENADQNSTTLRLPFLKGILAGKLGCRPENLSRAFSTLREFGVETHGSRIILHDVALLRDFAAPDEPDYWKATSASEAFIRAFDL